MIKDFTLSATNEAYLIEKIKNLDKTNTLYTANIVPKKSKRSISQNKLYFSFMNEFGAYLGYESEQMHELCKFKFLRNRIEINGEALPLLNSTTKLTTKEFSDYFEACVRWAASLGYIFEEMI